MTPDEISAYLARTLPADRREAVARHLSACDDCRQDVIRAAELLDGERRRRWALVALPGAAAVVAALLVVPGVVRGPADSPAPVMRSEPTEAVRTFEALLPGDGDEVAAESVRFEWRSEGPAARYRLTMTSQLGDVVWEESTADTTLTLPPDVMVTRGGRYFWRVDALLPGAESSTTGFRSFTVAEQ